MAFAISFPNLKHLTPKTTVRVANGATHTGNLWASDGSLLASEEFIGETSSGWQEVLFSEPVSISADTTYIVSYNSPGGTYISDSQYFAGVTQAQKKLGLSKNAKQLTSNLKRLHGEAIVFLDHMPPERWACS